MRRMERKKKERSRYVWQDDATRLFLKLWFENIDDLQGSRKNTQIHKEMADRLYKFNGPNHIEIKTKIDNMTKKYRTEALRTRRTGEPSSWEYFDEVHEILKSSKLVNLSLCMAENFDFSPMEDSDSADSTDGRSISFSPHTAQSKNTELPRGPRNDLISNAAGESKDNSSRLLEIEDEKLAIKREELKMLKSIADELSAVHRSFLKAYKLK